MKIDKPFQTDKAINMIKGVTAYVISHRNSLNNKCFSPVILEFKKLLNKFFSLIASINNIEHIKQMNN